MEQKKFLVDAKKETTKLAEGLTRLETEVSELKSKVDSADMGCNNAKEKKEDSSSFMCKYKS